MNKINKYVEQNCSLYLENFFGQWIDSLWLTVDDLNFEEEKEVFFLTLEMLLYKKYILLYPPLAAQFVCDLLRH
jgi:hypothetical protein